MGERPSVPLNVDVISLFDWGVRLSWRSIAVADYVGGGVIRGRDEAIVAACGGPSDYVWRVGRPSAGVETSVVVVVDDEVGYVGMCR